MNLNTIIGNKKNIKRIIIIFLICINLLLIIPNNVIRVSAALPILICDWDTGTTTGNNSGTSGFLSWKNMGTVNYFMTSTSYSVSSPRSFYIKGLSPNVQNGYFNLTDSFNYIGKINISFYPVNFGNEITFTFYTSDGIPVILFSFLYSSGTEKYQWYDISSGYHTIRDNLGEHHYYLVIQHNCSNQFNIKILDDTFAVLGNDDYAGYSNNAYTNWSYIKVGGSCSTNNDLYIDNFYIDTTYNYNMCPGPLPEGYLGVNCYDEINGTNISDFHILAVNTIGDSFFEYDLDNTYVVWGDLLPQGECTITVGATGYYSRSYVVDVEDGFFIIGGITYDTVTIDAYLPAINLSFLYLLNVVGPPNEYSENPPLENVRMVIKGFCGNASYETVSDTYTDGNGQTYAYLIPGRLYKVALTKDGYTSKTEEYIPSLTIFTHTFRMSLTESEIPVFPNCDYYYTNISFTATMLTNNTIFISYNDINASTINCMVSTYSSYNGTNTLNGTHYDTNDTFSYYVTDINTSRQHLVIMYFNNTANFCDQTSPVTLILFPITVWTNNTKFNVDDRITDLVGPSTIGPWSTIIAVILPIIILVSFGPYNVGAAIIGSGLSLGFMEGLFGMWFTDAFNPLLAILVPVLVVIGIIYAMTKGDGESQL